MKNARAAAFPHLDPSCQRIDETEQTPGLTKREYAAIHIAAGIKANSIPGSHHQPLLCVKETVELVDLLFAELNK